MLLDLVQWPAMAVTLLAAWLVTARSKGRRRAGFWCFLASNALWITWGLAQRADALVCLQLGLAALNILGARKNARQADAEAN